jgi:hypothetical protein
MNWKNRQVLVTGAGGFIASHLVERLVKDGAQVRAFVRYNSRNDVGMLRLISPDVFSALEVVRGDLRDTEAVRRVVKNVDTVFHLGALIAIPYSYVNPREVIDVNIMGTLNVLWLPAIQMCGAWFIPQQVKCMALHNMYQSTKNIHCKGNPLILPAKLAQIKLQKVFIVRLMFRLLLCAHSTLMVHVNPRGRLSQRLSRRHLPVMK